MSLWSGPLALALEVFTRGSLLLILAFSLAALLRNRTAAMRHSVWSAAFVALLLLPPLALLKTGVDIAILPPRAEAAFPTEAASALSLGSPVAERSTVLETSPPPSAEASPGMPRGAWIGGVYSAGALFFLLPWLAGVLRLAWLTARAAPLEPPWQREPVRREVRLLSSSEVQAPLTWGALRPVILLPARLARESSTALDRAILHELAHVRRFDWLTQAMARVACCLFWFHPGAWAARKRLLLEAERAADDQVLLAGFDAHDYAQQLVHLVRSLRGSVPGPADCTVAMARKGNLDQRVLSLLDRKRRRRGPKGVKAAALALAILAVMLTAAVPRPVAMAVGQDSTPAEGPWTDGPMDRALVEAADDGEVATVRALLDAGANPDATIEGDGTPLIRAAGNGDLELAEILLAAGADVRREAPGDGNPLIAAAREGHLEMVRLLLDRGAFVNDVVEEDETALIQAAGTGHLEVVRALVDRGADIHREVLANGRERRTALGQAIKGGHREVESYLRRQGAASH